MNKTCKWVYEEYYDYWETECGESQQFIEDGIKENNYKYCPYCGKNIIETKGD
jgi:DNA-directed RNA polymerase subunit RPC12/RpoP